jgi:hypothetical protein
LTSKHSRVTNWCGFPETGGSISPRPAESRPNLIRRECGMLARRPLRQLRRAAVSDRRPPSPRLRWSAEARSEIRERRRKRAARTLLLRGRPGPRPGLESQSSRALMASESAICERLRAAVASTRDASTLRTAATAHCRAAFRWRKHLAQRPVRHGVGDRGVTSRSLGPRGCLFGCHPEARITSSLTSCHERCSNHRTAVADRVANG